MMTHATAHYQTVLLIRVEESDVGGDRFPAGQQGHRPDDELNFVRTALLESGICHESRILGEQLLGLFSNADAAVEVACAVQRACAEHGLGTALDRLRILLDQPGQRPISNAQDVCSSWDRDHGEQLLQKLPPGQIYLTGAVTGQLGEQSRARFRWYQQEDSNHAELYQLVCHEETVTCMAGAPLNQDRISAGRNLSLRWRDNTMTVQPESPSLTIGRSDQADVRIDSELASRIHARVGFYETNFLLADQSTNGTFVQIDDDDEVYLHHEQIVLRGSGVISLGRRLRGGRGKLIYFNLTA